MPGEPLTHLLIRPSPFKGVGISVVVFRPGSQHVSLELVLALPGRPFQVIVLESVDEDFCLLQPRGIGRRITRRPPPLTTGKVRLRAARYVTCPSILDQEHPQVHRPVPGVVELLLLDRSRNRSPDGVTLQDLESRDLIDTHHPKALL